MALQLANPTSNYEEADLIPGLARWVNKKKKKIEGVPVWHRLIYSVVVIN